MALAKIAGLLKINIPISRENILGLLATQYTDPDESMRRLSIKLKTTAEQFKAMHVDINAEG